MKPVKLFVLLSFCLGLAGFAEAMPASQCAGMARLSQSEAACFHAAAKACCGTSSCECRIQLPSKAFDASIQSEVVGNSHRQVIQSHSKFVPVPKTTLKSRSVSEESPPQDDPLYERYSVYRI